MSALVFLVRSWTGAGFAMGMFALFMLLISGFELYEFSEMISVPIVLIFYGYGIVCSLLLQALSHKFRKIGVKSKLALYAVAGFGIFLAQGVNIYAMIAGAVGAICALVFFAGVVISGYSRAFTAVFALVAPLALFIVMQTDFSVKRGWTETVEPSRYIAAFDYFNGEHEIPIYAEKGQLIIFKVTFGNENEGGYGLRARSEADRTLSMRKIGESYEIQAEQSGVYRIVVSGDNLQGSIEVDWEIMPARAQ